MSDQPITARDRILQAARSLFLEQGYNGSNLRDIATAANVSMGGIYHHFSSKEEIYVSLLPATELAQRLPRVLNLFRDAAFPHNLSEIGRAIFELVRDNTTDFKLVYIDILEFQGRNIKPIIEALYVRFAADSRKLLAHHPEEGVLRPVHPAVFTRSIIALFLHFYLESVMLQISLSEDIGLSEDEIADQMADLLLHGIIVREP